MVNHENGEPKKLTLLVRTERNDRDKVGFDELSDK